MIGMMYLVLTALLALQVSNSVLEKFVFIDETLQMQSAELEEKNTKLVSSIKQEVDKKGNRADDKKALDKAQQVREMTHEVLEYMNGLRKEFVEITGGRDENGQLVGAKDDEIVSSFMVTQGNGTELKKKLNDYSQKLKELTGDQEFEPLARDAKNIEIAKNDPDQKNKTFEEYYFMKTPTAAGMATISQLETEVLNYEQKALEDLAEQVGAKDVEFSTIVPLVRPVSNTVAAGAKFEADLFITASAEGLNPTFMYENKEVKSETNEYGIKYGRIEFTATPGAYGPDLTVDKSFEAEIELNDSTYKIKHNYKVVKPVIQVKSAALSALYMNCGNNLDIQVPALGTSYNPSFSSGDAKVVKGNKTGLVTVVPQGRSKVKLTVSNAGSVLGTETFDVKKVPPPSIEITNRGKPVNMDDGEKAAALSSIRVSAVPDENFKREVPEDARYRVSQVEVKLARGGRQIKVEKFNSENVDLRAFRSQFRPGDVLKVKVERVTRRTYTGESERAKPLTEIYSIPIN